MPEYVPIKVTQIKELVLSRHPYLRKLSPFTHRRVAEHVNTVNILNEQLKLALSPMDAKSAIAQARMHLTPERDAIEIDRALTKLREIRDNLIEGVDKEHLTTFIDAEHNAFLRSKKVLPKQTD